MGIRKEFQGKIRGSLEKNREQFYEEFGKNTMLSEFKRYNKNYNLFNFIWKLEKLFVSLHCRSERSIAKHLSNRIFPDIQQYLSDNDYKNKIINIKRRKETL